MPLPTITTYPVAATNETWQRKKSVTDKLIKTQVGPALVLAKQKWDAIKFEDLDSAKVAKTPKAAKAALDKAKTAWPQVGAALTAIRAAWTVADTQSRNTKLSSTSKTALTGIAKALKEAETRLDHMDDILGAFQIDLRNATEAANANWTNLEITSGSKILAHAKKAKRANDQSYEVSEVTWTVSVDDSWAYLKKKVSVSAFDGTGERIENDMTLGAITGTDRMRLK